ncbi:MAG TPA: alpha-D-ribose 1-methylphosphonate 5-triphosphate diphosphatase [Methylomirabilota bacterium]|nr:alpha-D-ribose 1-methylphosphonate 5-triphosphate diphosphatase [Methylomirabilota bacterium]
MKGASMLFTNAQVVTPDEVFLGSVTVENGMIMDVEPGRSAARPAVDLEGDYLVPGVVELHTDVLERHAIPRPNVHWPPMPAVLAYDSQLVGAGITTVLDSLAIGYLIDTGQRPRDPRPLVEAIRSARDGGLLRADHYLHMRCEVSTALVVQDFSPFADDPLVRLVSLMDHAPGQRQFVDVAKYREYNQGRYGLTDAQLDALVERRMAEQGRYAAEHRAQITALCRKHGLPVASHDDATSAHVDEAMQAGAVIAEFPTTLEAARAAHDYGLAVLAGAPNLVRGRSHSGNVPAADLAARGWLDVLSSDYVPASVLHGAFLLHTRHGLALAEAVATVSATPARRVGLDDRGALLPGRRADLVRVRVVAGDLVVVRGVWVRGDRAA